MRNEAEKRTHSGIKQISVTDHWVRGGKKNGGRKGQNYSPIRA